MPNPPAHGSTSSFANGSAGAGSSLGGPGGSMSYSAAPLSIRDGTFAWDGSGEPVLRDVTLEVPRGQLVMVVGQVRAGRWVWCVGGGLGWVRGGGWACKQTSSCVLLRGWNGRNEAPAPSPRPCLPHVFLSRPCSITQVGSGKSSLLAALLGEMNRRGGSVRVMGSVAYTAQVGGWVCGGLQSAVRWGCSSQRWQAGTPCECSAMWRRAMEPAEPATCPCFLLTRNWPLLSRCAVADPDPDRTPGSRTPRCARTC